MIFDLAASALSLLPPEAAHRTTVAALKLGLGPVDAGPDDPCLAVELAGMQLPSCIGLAAGFDKDAQVPDAMLRAGFGFVECGSVTPRPQVGNPRPRLFRLGGDRAVINRMGFNNDGAEVVARRLAERKRRRVARVAPTRHATGADSGVLGVNIGKTKVVAEEDAIADYEKSTRLLSPYADYLVVNVSSPNTPGLRDLQAVEKLEPLLTAVRAEADRHTDERVPLLVKIAPDLSDDDVLAVADLAIALGLDGIIATNTTISRDGLATDADAVAKIGAGGLSGKPLTARANEVMRTLRARVGEELTLIGVGGITTPDDARERLAAGATLLQGYTAFIYEGPRWPRTIVSSLG